MDYKLINNEEEYIATSDVSYTYYVVCKNDQCPSYNLEYGNVLAETEYPYILCGPCGQQTTNLKRYGDSEWSVIEDAQTFFSRIGTI